MPKLIVLSGLPGSGKTEYSLTWVAQNPGNRIRVCRREIRKMLSPAGHSPPLEKLTSTLESTAVRGGLRRGFDVIIDANNLDKFVLGKWHDLQKILKEKESLEVTVETLKFNRSVDECIIHDSKKPPGDRAGKGLILHLYNKYLRPSLDEMEWE